MRLRDLDARFIRYTVRTETWTKVVGDPTTWKPGGPTQQVTGPRVYLVPVKPVGSAQGIRFRCPKCKGVGEHDVEVTFANRGVASDHGTHNAKGEPTRWTVSGTSLDDLTLKPSIQLEGGCGWHGFVTNGDAA